jgi:hypothetical protein
MLLIFNKHMKNVFIDKLMDIILSLFIQNMIKIMKILLKQLYQLYLNNNYKIK